MKKTKQPTNQPAKQVLDVIMCEYVDGEVILYPLKPDYETALLECRVSIKSGLYSAFTFFRVSFPDETIRALNCLTKDEERGPSPIIKSMAPLPMEFKEIIWEIAKYKGIVSMNRVRNDGF